MTEVLAAASQVPWLGPFLAIAIGLGMAIAVFGCGLSQARAISASVEATARQPEAGGRIFTSMILGVAFIETLVLFTFAIMAFYLTPQLEKVVKSLTGIE